MWKSIKNIAKSDSNFALTSVDHHVLPDINFIGHYLTNNISIPKKIINLHISYIINQCPRCLNTYFTLGYCLFESLELTKNTDPDKYKYSGYSIGFDS